MAYFTFQQQIGASWGALGVDIRDLVLLETSGTPVVLATTGPGGGMLSLRFENGLLQEFDQLIFSDAVRSVISGFSALLVQGSHSHVVLGASAQGEIVSYEFQADGGLMALSSPSLPVHVLNSGPVIATSAQGYIYTMTGEGWLQGFREVSDGYQVVATHTDTSESYAADPVVLEVVRVGGTEYLVSLSQSDVGVSMFRIDPQNGALSVADAVGVSSGLGLLSNPTDLQTVTVDGTVYAIVSSASDSAEGGALTVVSIGTGGVMQVTDYILDSRETRFGGAHTVEVIQVGGWTYVVAGGGDAGLSLFTLMPEGRLLHLDTIEDTVLS